MKKENHIKIIKIVDNLLNFSIFPVISNLVYLMIFGILFLITFIGIKMKIFDGYFEYIVIIFILVYSFKEADRYLSNLPGLWRIIGMGIFTNFIMLAVGYDIQIFNVMIFLSIIIIAIKFYYLIGIRKYIIKKFKLTKKEILELEKNKKTA